jgi:hypothetical protein
MIAAMHSDLGSGGVSLDACRVGSEDPVPPIEGTGSIEVSLLFGLGILDALLAEFLALFALQAFLVGLLGALERFGGAGLCGLCRGSGCSRIRLGSRCCRRLSENGGGEQKERRAEGGGQAGRYRHEKYLGGLKRASRLRRDAEPPMNRHIDVFRVAIFLRIPAWPLSHALATLGWGTPEQHPPKESQDDH